MKTILVPIDFSQCSLNALEYAIKMANKMNASIEVLHVYQIPQPIGDTYIPPEVINSLDLNREDVAIGKFTDFIMDVSSKIYPQAENVPINVSLKRGLVHTDILESAQQLRVDLIVMGTTGASGIKEMFVGSVAGEVMENAYCPVLAIPEYAIFDGEIKTIVVPTDYSEENRLLLNYLVDWSNNFGAQLKCFHIDLAHTEAYTLKMQALASKFDGNRNITFDVVEGNNLLDEIQNYVEMHQADVLAMMVHKRNFFQELFNQSNAKQLAYKSNIPVLAFQSHLLK